MDNQNIPPISSQIPNAPDPQLDLLSNKSSIFKWIILLFFVAILLSGGIYLVLKSQFKTTDQVRNYSQITHITTIPTTTTVSSLDPVVPSVCRDGWIDSMVENSTELPENYIACVRGLITIMADINKPVREVTEFLQNKGIIVDEQMKRDMEYEHKSSIDMMTKVPATRQDSYFQNYHLTLKVKSGSENDMVNSINKEPGYKAQLKLQTKAARL